MKSKKEKPNLDSAKSKSDFKQTEWNNIKSNGYKEIKGPDRITKGTIDAKKVNSINSDELQ